MTDDVSSPKTVISHTETIPPTSIQHSMGYVTLLAITKSTVLSWFPFMKSTGTLSTKESQRLDHMIGYRDRNPSNGRQTTPPSCHACIMWCRNFCTTSKPVPSNFLVNSLAPGKFEWNLGHVIFKQILVIDGWGMSWYCPNMNVTGLHWWSVNIGSGNGLVPSGNKPLPDPMLTQIFVATWHH